MTPNFKVWWQTVKIPITKKTWYDISCIYGTIYFEFPTYCQEYLYDMNITHNESLLREEKSTEHLRQVAKGTKRYLISGM